MTAFPDFGLTPAERHEAVFGHRYEHPGMGSDAGEIWCYTDSIAYSPGANVRLSVCSTVPSCQLAIVRDGAQARPVLQREVRGARWQDTPEQCSVVGCGWSPSVEFRVGEDWPSGAYRITLTAQGPKGNELSADHLFIVRPAAGAKPQRILQVAASGTWTPTTPGGARITTRESRVRSAINTRRP